MTGECAFPGCDRRHFSGGHCAGHYKQRREGKELKPLRTERGQGTRINIRMPQSLRDAAALEAQQRGISEGQWWKEAAMHYLTQKP